MVAVKACLRMFGRSYRREYKGRVENFEFGSRGRWDERGPERRMEMKRCRLHRGLDRPFDSPKDHAKSGLVPDSDVGGEAILGGHPVIRYAIHARNPGAARRPIRGW